MLNLYIFHSGFYQHCLCCIVAHKQWMHKHIHAWMHVCVRVHACMSLYLCVLHVCVYAYVLHLTKNIDLTGPSNESLCAHFSWSRNASFCSTWDMWFTELYSSVCIYLWCYNYMSCILWHNLYNYYKSLAIVICLSLVRDCTILFKLNPFRRLAKCFYHQNSGRPFEDNKYGHLPYCIGETWLTGKGWEWVVPCSSPSYGLCIKKTQYY